MSAASDDFERQALLELRALLDTDPARRAAGIEAIADPALRVRVAALLAQATGGTTAAQGGEADSDPIGPGHRLGPYRVLERIGRGGMGEVFRAKRCDGAFEREVALKCIWGGLAPLAERFQRERELLAQLQHPGIARLYDGGVAGDGRPWFAMELVRGAPITEWCDAREAALEQRAELLSQVCAAVDAAHRALIVHRDLKPANVLVDEDGRVKLLDFGIAKQLQPDAGEQAPTLAMTPAWAAPEQRDGRPITTATDVYQLGRLLRALLIGVPAATDIGGPRVAAAYRALRRRDPQAALRLAAARATTPARLQARLRGDLDCIAARACAEEPAQRYRSAAALAEDLQRWLARRPVAVRGEDRLYRLRRLLRRQWPAFAASAAGLALAVAGGVYHLQRLDRELVRTRTARDAATAAQGRAEAQRERAEATAEYFVDLFKQARPRQTDGGEVSARELLSASLEQLLSDRERDPRARASLLAANARAWATLGRMREADRAAAAAIGLMQTDPGADAETLIKTRMRRIGYLHHLQRSDRAQQELDAALALAAKRPSRDPELGTQLQLWRANLASERDDAPTARDAYGQVLKLTAAALQRPAACRLHYGALGNLAMLDIDQHRPADAERRLRRALEMIGPCGIRDRADGLILRRVLTVALIDQARMAEARALADDVAAQSRAHFGADDSFLRHALYVQALVELADGRVDAALTRLPEVIRGDAAHLPAQAPARRDALGLQALAWIARADAGEPGASAMAMSDAVPGAAAAADLAAAVRVLSAVSTDAPGTPSDPAARFHALALAYAQCRRRPSTSQHEAFAAALRAVGELRPWRARLSRDWSRRCGTSG
ncbi:serine/threonine-protein kinase [Lysobacter firmicutimachus]|uniref:Serine/threonine-protein kinase n=2 Tax=Lysobacter TaxID=68 RepID=A0ABU8D8M6_9GAMM